MGQHLAAVCVSRTSTAHWKVDTNWRVRPVTTEALASVRTAVPGVWGDSKAGGVPPALLSPSVSSIEVLAERAQGFYHCSVCYGAGPKDCSYKRSDGSDDQQPKVYPGNGESFWWWIEDPRQDRNEHLRNAEAQYDTDESSS